MTKRIFALLLALVLVVGMLPTGALATSEESGAYRVTLYAAVHLL